tara:strand:+ start:921 stop:1259 length:339 start_codon:yes stop_codon:yes gene_type:complete
MGYFLNKDFEDKEEPYFGGIPAEFVDEVADTEKQIEFHKNNFINSDLGLVAEVLKKMIFNMEQEISKESADSIMPLLSGMAEAIIMLRAELQVLRGALIEKKQPPPDFFDMN